MTREEIEKVAEDFWANIPTKVMPDDIAKLIIQQVNVAFEEAADVCRGNMLGQSYIRALKIKE